MNKDNLTREATLAAGQFNKERDYWLQKLSGDLVKTHFPYDNPQIGDLSQLQSYTMQLNGQLYERLLKLCGASDHILHMCLLAGVTAVANQYSRNDDIIIGAPIYRQEEGDTFVNTVLSLRSQLTSQMTFKDLLVQIKQTVTESNENLNYPIETLLIKLELDKHQADFPLFDIVVLLENIHERKYINHIQVNSSFYFNRSENALDCEIVFNSNRFNPQTIERIAAHFTRLLTVAAFDVNLPLSQIETLSPEENKQISQDFNRFPLTYAQDSSIVYLFRQQLQQQPQVDAVVDETRSLTYQQLDEESLSLALLLRNQGVSNGSIVALLVDRTVDMITGIMAILKAGAAYVPIDTQYPQERIDYILRDSGACLILTTNEFAKSHFPIPLLTIDQQPIAFDSSSLVYPQPCDPAYVIYTSGSTGRPKGVVVTHKNVLNLVAGLEARIYSHLSPQMKVALVAPYFFDASVQQIFAALLLGHSLIIVPENTRSDGNQLLNFYSTHNIDVSDGTPTHLRLIIESTEKSISNLNIRHFIIGGDTLPQATVSQFLNLFKHNPPTITNVYGPTECTVDSTSFEINTENVSSLQRIPIGNPMPNEHIHILDPYNKFTPIGVPGELFISGEGVSLGYINNPELTASSFNRFFGTNKSCRSYKTGDLARWLPDGNIQFLGRTDFQVKVRGFRIELGEIENQLLTFQSVTAAVVIVRADQKSDNYLCAYLVAQSSLTAPQVRDYLSGKLPDYMLPTHFVFMESLPLTPNGKVDRKKLPEPQVTAGENYQPPRNEVEVRLVNIWADLLGLEQDVIGIDHDFFAIGGHSLKATVMIARVHKTFNVKIPLMKMFETPTIRQLSQLLAEAAKETYIAITPAEKKSYYPLSSAQQRLYILQHSEPNAVTYNIPMFAILEGPLDVVKLTDAFSLLMQRHGSLRTSFHLIAGEPAQKVHDILSFAIETEPELLKSDTFIRPFDLSLAPLFRVGLLRENNTRHRLFMDMHHIISDGTSMAILTKEFMALYEGQQLPSLYIRYVDYSQWQSNHTGMTSLKQQEQYWLDQFAGDIPVLDLPCDFSRPKIQDFAGSSKTFNVQGDAFVALKNLALQEGVTLFMLLLSVYTILISKISNQQDIVVGTPTSGRQHADLEPIVGMFVNTIALRNKPLGEKPFSRYLQEVKQKTLEAFGNQDYQYEELVDHLPVNRDAGRNPLFDVMFALQNQESNRLEITGLTFRPTPIQHKIAKFDLTLNCIEKENSLTCTFEYSTRLFREETITRFSRYFTTILAVLQQHPDENIHQIEILSDAERQQLLYDFNDNKTPFPRNKTIPQLFYEQVQQRPHSIALIGESNSVIIYITYDQLFQRAAALAQLLAQRGVTHQDNPIVGILTEPSLEMVIGILAILMAGGAYMPIDTGYPKERIDFMLNDSCAQILLVSAAHEKKIPGDKEIISLEHAINSSATQDCSIEHVQGDFAGNLAYVIYTSGSTGTPKGTLTRHDNVIRVVRDTNYIQILHHDRILQLSNYAFDGSVFNIYGALLNGAALVQVQKEEVLAIDHLAQWIARQQITVFFVTTALFNTLVDLKLESLSAVRKILFGGERVSVNHVRKALDYFGPNHLIHVYGPTETTVYATFHPVNSIDVQMGTIPIGSPISNTDIHILDATLSPVPIGTSGEIYISGPGVARGYLNNPRLTHSFFITYESNWSYKTGDLGRWLPDGTIQFLGRIDHQVKVRGFRVEPGEIEARLLAVPDILEVKIIAAQKKSGEKYLCAYFTAKSELQSASLKDILTQQLPDYMVPPYFVQLIEMPLNANGKVDSKRLPHPEIKNDRNFIAPGNDYEKEIAAIWKDVLELQQVGIDDNFFEIGGNSLDTVKVSHRLKEAFTRDLPAVILFRYPTIRTMAAYLAQKESPFDGYTQDRVTPEKGRHTSGEGLEIAVIGMSCRFPGAESIAQYWNNLKNGVESITTFSQQHLLDAGIDPQLLGKPNYVRAKGSLKDIESFDASFFGYTPREAAVMDPQMRILHQCAWEALEDAAYNSATYSGRIGLYCGGGASFNWEALTRLTHIGEGIDHFTKMNLNNKDFLATRISYKLDLKGPAFTVNTACSTSLVAIHLAIQGLLNGECEIALAGGVQVSLPGDSGYLYQEGMIMSPNGQCRAFDAKAKGTVGGDGCGVVVLKPLVPAIDDRDNIYAQVKGGAINNDGIRKTGFQAPSIEGQAEVIKAAMQVASVDPQSISYIEAHGTGTPLGDPVEIEALKLAFNTPANKVNTKYCAIGSVKTNIGHLNSAAGVSGFIKTVLALKHRLIPPSLHFENPNPNIDFDHSPFYVNAQPSEWKSDKYPLRAGISSFGIGGTNAHIILEEWQIEPQPQKSTTHPQLLLFSARTPDALQRMTLNLTNHLKETSGSLNDIAYTLQVGRKRLEHRKMLVCNSHEEAIQELTQPTSPLKQQQTVMNQDAPPVVFMFPGQGSQYIDMGRGLYQSQVIYRREMDRCFNILNTLMDTDVKEILYPKSEGITQKNDTIHQTAFTQPILFAHQYALAQLLMEWGIKPYAMIGHSISEYVAACLAQVFSLEDALKLVVQRGKLMQTMPSGKMTGVPLSEEQLEPLLQQHNQLNLSVLNSSQQSVVSGTHEAIDTFEEDLRQKDIRFRSLLTSHAFHSHMMNPILDSFKTGFADVAVGTPQIPYISNLTGQWISQEEAGDPRYWSRHLRETVRFASGLDTLMQKDNLVFLEVGPGKTLGSLARHHHAKKDSHVILNSIRHPNEETSDIDVLFSCIGRLWLNGVNPDWNRFHEPHKPYRQSLPLYPFEKTSFPIPRKLLNAKHPQYNPISPSHSLENQANDPLAHDTASNNSAPNLRYNRPQLSTQFVAPDTGNLIQTTLAKIWCDFFGIQAVGIDDDFFELGGDSLKIMTIISTIHKELQVQVPMADFFNHPNIRSLALYIDTAEGTHFMAIQPIELKQYYCLSSAQKRIYILQQLDKEGVTYNMPQVQMVTGEIQQDKLETALQKMILRHESFRTSFHIFDRQPMQRIHSLRDTEFEIEYYDLQTSKAIPSTIEATTHNFIRPFDLSRAPLMRVAYGKISQDKGIFMLDMHHIISDGSSYLVFLTELLHAYEGRSLAPLKVQYKDYSYWRSAEHHGAGLKTQEKYWRETLSGQLPVIQLPTDYPRPAVQRFKGKKIKFQLDTHQTEAVHQLAKQEDVTLYMLLLAIYNIFLAKISRSSDIIVGTPTAGRRHNDLKNVIGMFVNTLCIRSYPSAEKQFTDFLQEVKTQTLDAFENQEFAFEDLVEDLALNRDTSRNPLFDVMFMLHNMEMPIIQATHIKLQPYTARDNTSKFDLTFQAAYTGKHLKFTVEYSTCLFKEETILRFINHFKTLLTSVLENKQKSIHRLEIITEEEKKRLIQDFNQTDVQYSHNKTIHRLFEEQVARTPLSIAVAGQAVGEDLSYSQLNKRSSQLANLLRDKGVVSETIVTIMMTRTPHMIVAIMAVLKAGGAYLPIEPNYPAQRVQFMLKDSGASIILTNDKNLNFDGLQQVTVTHDSDFGTPSTHAHEVVSNNLAYLIYTSGSTGNPKGVMIEHQAVVNFIEAIIDVIPFSPNDSLMSLTTITFDIFGLETLLPLTAGTRIVLGSSQQQTEPAAAAMALKDERISILQLTPSRLQLLLADPQTANSLKSLRYLLIGGEALPAPLLEKAKQFTTGKIYNMYGPTETTIWSAIKDVSGRNALNIGKPIANTQIYISDNHHNIQPIGIPGELLIAGDGLARGYLNNPELTATKFCQEFNGSHPSYLSYKTGDLARWLPDGNIQFLGRIDHQVKIRGYRIELAEIESQLLKQPHVKEAAVIVKEINGDPHLCAYVVLPHPDQPLDTAKLNAPLSELLPDYMIPQFFTALDHMPLTPSGKIDRKQLPHPQISAQQEITLPTDDLEKELLHLWTEALEVEPELIGIDTNFFRLGGHSLKATILVSQIHRTRSVRVPLAEIFNRPTIRAQAQFIKAAAPETYQPIQTAAYRDYYPLSFHQERLWFIYQVDPQSAAFNMPVKIPIPHTVPPEDITSVLTQLVQRHQSLRTGFRMEGNKPVQYILEDIPLPLEIVDTQTLADSSDEQEENALKLAMQVMNQPFQLEKPPLFRAMLQIGTNRSLLIFNMHHIISDGQSLVILQKEFQHLLSTHQLNQPASKLPPLEIHYKDFACWQSQQMAQPALKEKSHRYWEDILLDGLAQLNLPRDNNPVNHATQTAACSINLGESLMKKLEVFANERNVSLFMLMFALQNWLFSRLTQQQDIVIGIAAAGREHADLQQVVGFFVNTVIAKNKVNPAQAFNIFLQQLEDNTREALQNQNYPLELVVQDLKIKYPKIPVLFNMLNMKDGRILRPGTQTSDIRHFQDVQDVKFELELYVSQYPNDIEIQYHYRNALFKPETIQYIMEEYVKLLNVVLENPGASLDDYRGKSQKRTFARKSFSKSK
jgi:amino acid adenylation domain-containing protein